MGYGLVLPRVPLHPAVIPVDTAEPSIVPHPVNDPSSAPGSRPTPSLLAIVASRRLLPALASIVCLPVLAHALSLTCRDTRARQDHPPAHASQGRPSPVPPGVQVLSPWLDTLPAIAGLEGHMDQPTDDRYPRLNPGQLLRAASSFWIFPSLLDILLRV